MNAFKAAKKHPGYLEVNQLGQVRNAITKHILKPRSDTKGNHQVRYYKDGKHVAVSVAQTVLTTFNDEIGHTGCIKHKDGDKSNNALSNLDWYYEDHRKNNRKKRKGIVKRNAAPHYKLTDKQTASIISLYRRGSSEYGYKGLARKFNVSFTTIYRIIKKGA